MEDRLISRVDEILETHKPLELDPMLEKEIDLITQAAYRELEGFPKYD
jgi:hypothetical protein